MLAEPLEEADVKSTDSIQVNEEFNLLQLLYKWENICEERRKVLFDIIKEKLDILFEESNKYGLTSEQRYNTWEEFISNIYSKVSNMEKQALIELQTSFANQDVTKELAESFLYNFNCQWDDIFGALDEIWEHILKDKISL